MAESKYKFERLTPTNDVNLDVYEDAINYIFNNSDIKNVAISGAYSAGKSSVLASYKKNHSDKVFLHISLAHFQSPNEEKENGDKATEVKESVLEGKILNQLIHQIPADKIPQTNFRVKKRVSCGSIIAKTLETIILLTAIIYFACFDLWKNYVQTLPANWLKKFLELSTHPYALMIDGIIIIVLLWFLIYGLIKIQKNKNVFRKLNLQGNEIEIFEESDDSYFDKYLNEVLYLFENADADVIVFEDMDRFNANRIFERLREVNTLANIQLKKENKKLLRFFYLLRDDIFVSKDRTKFFDYIMPVVPVLDGSNSYDQFISHFKKGGFFEKFDESFLQGLSLYIDDMRLLKNIYNEFLIYFNRLNITELDCNKMLAIIAYKNLFPRDFADLQLNHGFVYTLFNTKDVFISIQMDEIKKSIEEKKNVICAAKHNHLKSIHELNVVFAQEYLSNYSWHSYDRDRLQDFVSRHLHGNYLNRYSARKQELEMLLNADSCELEEEISLLEQKLLLLKNQQLNQIITRDNIDSIFSITSTNEIGTVTDFNEIKSSEYFDLLKYLIRNGYIDETYADYMTYFYENSLSRIDKTFLRSVTDRKAKEYNYQLRNPQMVVSRLRLVDFDQEEILNFSLFTYLLHTQNHVEYLKRFIEQLRETRNFKFIGEYFDVTSEMSSYINYLNTWWPDAFGIALDKHALSERQIRKYSIYTLYYSDKGTIGLVNKNHSLCDYISNSRDYLAIDHADIDKLIYGFKLLGVCFVGFDYEILNQKLFYAVYQESLYKINAENLKLVQIKIFNICNDDDILHKNYSLLLSHPDSAITQYINRNINEYFAVVLQMCGGIIFDDNSTVILVLNNPDLIIEHKHAYISALRTTIVFISEVTDPALWEEVLDANIVEYSERNIMDSFKVLELSQSVISYINRCDIELDFSKLEDEESIKEKLFESVVKCGDILNPKYEQILVSLGCYYDDFALLNIQIDKLIILINTSIITMTAGNLNFLRDNYPNQKLCFIRKNIDRYVGIMSDDLFSQEELLEILTWDISDDLKIKLLEFSGDAISVIGKNYSTRVCIHILDHNFMRSDLCTLFASFEQWDAPVQKKIFNYAVINVTSIIDDPNSASEKLKYDLLKTDRLNRSTTIDLFAAMISHLDTDHIKEILILLNLTDYLKLFDTHARPSFKINDENEQLLTAFKERGVICAFEENSKRDGYYKITKPKPTKTLPAELL